MARTARKAPDDTGEIKAKDYGLAKKLYHGDIKPAKSKAAEHMQEASTAYKQVKKEANIQPAAMKVVIKLVEMEDAKRDDFLRCLNGLLREFGIDPEPKDLVDAMQGDDKYARPKPQLVTVPAGTPSDGTETDLANAAGDDFEASEEELAKQEGRAKPQPGTGAAAIAAMNETSAEAGQDAD